MGINTVMSKITQYLNEHILGEVTSAESVRQRYSRDGSVLTVTPELIVSPRVTNDIRKVARFSWQLAEKGHVLPLTVRGGGSDKTGASIGKGIVINMLAHLNNIIYINLKSKDQFVHTQPGVKFSALNDALKTHGMIVPTYPYSSAYSTIGGAVANNTGGMLSGQYGKTGDLVKRLEVVLANGDLIETTRISRRELDKKKGLQSFEGELYRKIDGIIEDNQSLISDRIPLTSREIAGYPGIAKVKGRDGSFDLTPLIVGSQGTLAIISEIVLRTDYYSADESIIVASFEDSEIARDAADIIAKTQPTSIELIDGELFKMAAEHGKKYPFIEADKIVGTVMFVVYNDFSDGHRNRKMKNALKKLSKFNATILTSKDHSTDELHAIREVGAVVLQSETSGESMPSLIDGASIPAERREEFISAVAELAKKHHISLPLSISWLDGVVHTRPALQLHSVGDKQKTFKLIGDYAEIVAKFDGDFCAESGEGRLKSTAAYDQMGPDLEDLYTQIRLAFDPFGTMNPGVKQKSDLKTLISQLNPDYDLADFAKYSPLN